MFAEIASGNVDLADVVFLVAFVLAGISAVVTAVRGSVDERFEARPRITEMVQLAAKVGQRLGIVRFRPERSGDPLTRDWRPPRVENQEGDEFLLPGTRSAASKAAVREHAEASEQLEAKTWACHRSSL